jgi:hypothetical protein
LSEKAAVASACASWARTASISVGRRPLRKSSTCASALRTRSVASRRAASSRSDSSVKSAAPAATLAPRLTSSETSVPGNGAATRTNSPST